VGVVNGFDNALSGEEVLPGFVFHLQNLKEEEI
jgi:hypothetical protein